MKKLKQFPFIIWMIVSVAVYEIVTGVPQVLAFADQKSQKKEAYQVTTLKEYQEPAVSSSNQESDNNLSANELSGGDSSGSDLSGNTVSDGGISHSDASVSHSNGNPSQNASQAGEKQEYPFSQVEEEYFNDAVFIGDSRTVGLHEYAKMDAASFYASTGLTVYKMFDSPVVELQGSKNKITIEEALKRKAFGKVYLMIGINEMGTGTVESFGQAYREAVAKLRELQPNAIIYVQAIMRVSKERSDKGDYINNEGIDARNEEIAKLADGEQIFYLDVNPEISDEAQALNASYTFDGVHLKAEYIPIWKDFLYSHAIIK